MQHTILYYLTSLLYFWAVVIVCRPTLVKTLFSLQLQYIFSSVILHTLVRVVGIVFMCCVDVLMIQRNLFVVVVSSSMKNIEFHFFLSFHFEQLLNVIINWSTHLHQQNNQHPNIPTLQAFALFAFIQLQLVKFRYGVLSFYPCVTCI